MTDHNYTDEEIIKALDKCRDRNCKECIRLNSGHNEESVCRLELLDIALNLVIRLKDMNEALINAQESLQRFIAEKNATLEKAEKLINTYLDKTESSE